MVMGDDSYSRGCGFESRCRILDGHFFTFICCKNCIVCLKRPKINKKEAGVGPFLKLHTHDILVGTKLIWQPVEIIHIFRVLVFT